MYKHLTPKKDQLFRRQVKQAFEQRQQNPNIQTNKETNKQNAIKKPPLHQWQLCRQTWEHLQ